MLSRASTSTLRVSMAAQASNSGGSSSNQGSDASSSGSDSSDGEGRTSSSRHGRGAGADPHSVERAIRLARERSSRRLQVQRASMPSLLAKFGVADLDAMDEKPTVTAAQLRQAQAVERAREAVRDLLVQRKLLELPCSAPAAGRSNLPHISSTNDLRETRSGDSQLPERSSSTGMTRSTTPSSQQTARRPPTISTSSPRASHGALDSAGSPSSLRGSPSAHRLRVSCNGLEPPSPGCGAHPSPSRFRSSCNGGDVVSSPGVARARNGSSRMRNHSDASSEEEVVDLHAVAREERRKLARVQSKIAPIIKQQRTQGLLGNRSGSQPLDHCDPDELTRAIVPPPARPPEGVQLKVPVDDIRFSGIKLRFLMALLEGIDKNPALCSSTLELVQNFVMPVTADAKCRLLDLVPTEQRGQPHHYVCHAWSCSARELLETLRRELLPAPPPRPPVLAPPKGKADKQTAKLIQRGRQGGNMPAAGGRGSDPGATHLPSIGGAGPQGRALPDPTRAGPGFQGSSTRLPGIGGLGRDGVDDYYSGLEERYQTDVSSALDQVVWVDFVCVNQHALVKRDYSKIAKTVVACGATVLVMDAQLTPLMRTWCIFEAMHCLRCNRHLKVFFADRSALSEENAAKLLDTFSMQDSKASSDEDRVGIMQEVINTVGVQYVNDIIRKAMRSTNIERSRQLATRRQQLATTMNLLEPDPAIIGTEEYERNLAECRQHLQEVLNTFYPEDVLRCIIPKDYVSDSARCWDLLCIFADILERELFRTDAKMLRDMAWLIFKRHSKRYIEVLYADELDNWLLNSLEHDRKWRRVQAKLKHDAEKKWNA